MTTGAGPYDHDEVFHGYRLFEGLTRRVGSIRHGPSHTSWVWAVRAVSPRGRSAIVFRPREDLYGRGHGGSIIEDVGAHAPASCFAMHTSGKRGRSARNEG